MPFSARSETRAAWIRAYLALGGKLGATIKASASNGWPTEQAHLSGAMTAYIIWATLPSLSPSHHCTPSPITSPSPSPFPSLPFFVTFYVVTQKFRLSR